MADKTAIEWTDATWNPVVAYHLGEKRGWYCEHVSEGCRNCYAEGINRRLGTGLEFKPGHLKDVAITVHDKTLKQPLHWKRPRMIFVNSMSDTFGSWVTEDMLDRMFAVMALGFHHTYQVLTKRPELARAYISDPYTPDRVCRVAMGLAASFADIYCDWMGANRALSQQHCNNIERGMKNERYRPTPARELLPWPLPNVWLGTSCEDQETADERIPPLLDTPAAVHFISAEPLLGPISLHPLGCGTNAVSSSTGPNLDWVIVGGESGPHARPMRPEWARSLRDQCEAVYIPFFFKQWGEWIYDERVGRKEMRGRDQPHAIDELRSMLRVGKKAAGRLLDGQKHSGFPHHG